MRTTEETRADLLIRLEKKRTRLVELQRQQRRTIGNLKVEMKLRSLEIAEHDASIARILNEQKRQAQAAE